MEGKTRFSAVCLSSKINLRHGSMPSRNDPASPSLVHTEGVKRCVSVRPKGRCSALWPVCRSKGLTRENLEACCASGPCMCKSHAITQGHCKRTPWRIAHARGVRRHLEQCPRVLAAFLSPIYSNQNPSMPRPQIMRVVTRVRTPFCKK